MYLQYAQKDIYDRAFADEQNGSLNKFSLSNRGRFDSAHSTVYWCFHLHLAAAAASSLAPPAGLLSPVHGSLQRA